MENLDLGINLGFGEDNSVDVLIEKLNNLENVISNINEISNTEIFINVLKNFQSLKDELSSIREELDKFKELDKEIKKSKTSNNPYEKETFEASQNLKNIENILRQILNATIENKKYNGGRGNNNNSNENTQSEFQKLINKQLKDYNLKYKNSDYRYKKNINEEIVSKLTDTQYKAFNKIVDGFDKKVLETLKKSIQDKIINDGVVKSLKDKRISIKSEDDLIKVYKDLSNTIKQYGLNENILKNNPKFKREYNDIKNSFDYSKQRAKELDKEYEKIFNKKRDTNFDDMNNREIKEYIKKTYEVINKERKFNETYKNIDESRYNNEKINFNNKVFEKLSKTGGLSTYNNDKGNTGISYSQYPNYRNIPFSTLTSMFSGFINQVLAKEFEKNIGSVGVVSGWKNNIEVNSMKNIVAEKSSNTGQDINEFIVGLREVMKTGKDFEQALRMMESTSKMAVASFENLTTATNIVNARFTALNIEASNKNLESFTNRLQSTLDNTALDLEDVSNAGKQTNTVLNSLISSAESKGLVNKNVEDYTMEVSNIELSLLGELRQQGKTGEQAGASLCQNFSRSPISSGTLS